MEPVVDPEPGAAIDKDARLPQDGQMPGDLGLWQVQGLGELADTALLAEGEEHEDAQPGGIGHGARQIFRLQMHSPGLAEGG